MYHSGLIFWNHFFFPGSLRVDIGIACFCSDDLYGLVNAVISAIVPVISLNSVSWKLQLGSLVSSNDHLGSIFGADISAFIPLLFFFRAPCAVRHLQ